MNDLLENKTIEDEMIPVMNRFLSFIPGISKSLAVPVVYAENLTKKEFIEKWVSRNKPCLVKNAVLHWPAVQKWKHQEYWLSQCDNFDINVYPHQNFNTHERQDAGKEVMPFHKAIERLFSDNEDTVSLPAEHITENGRFAKIKADMPGFTFLPETENPRYYQRMRFFSYRRAATGWHYHGIDETLMCQVNGTKRVALLSPEIPKPAYITKYLNQENYLNNEPFNVQHDINPYLVDVEEGDALYIPPYWHHVVVPVDGKVGFTVAFCWKSPLHILGDFSNYFVRALYKQGMWPLNINTFFMPLLGCYAGTSHLIRKLSRRV
ncbi:cupin-like domain-containing protein [Pedobacter sp. PF22-3]|uniref:cupin-like domain-containing protein n=1 Tax=Pedobacter sp. PF22-3 TaxID=2994467 RepID=UPI0022476E59|nr:cupin-like domain-containing protein [Pedobacter sp. PF22-3]MCX2492865.1 cupin-like domain-containing protein [Pedobacter sp. PF22-3]